MRRSDYGGSCDTCGRTGTHTNRVTGGHTVAGIEGTQVCEDCLHVPKDERAYLDDTDEFPAPKRNPTP